MLPAHLAFPIHHGTRIHIGVTGSVAAYKALELLRMFQELELVVSATLTEAATRFITPLSFEALGASHVGSAMWSGPDSAFGHLEPAQEASCMVIAPATANFLAKITHGIADDLLSTQALAFLGPLVVAPAMNPRLWQASANQANVDTLLARGVNFVGPACGAMACKESGKGRLASLESIVASVLKALTKQDLSGRKVLVTLGPTREFFDPARYWSNPSTGLMGGCLAMAAWLRGARVSVVQGSVSLWLPEDIERHPVESAQQMFDASVSLWPEQDYGIMTAAVSDFSPRPHGPEKFKKRGLADEIFPIDFHRNPDILKTLGGRKQPGQLLMGFCAETSDLLQHAAMKLQEKNCDLMVANRIGQADSGFASSTNRVHVLDRAGRCEEWPMLGKAEVAWRLLEWMTHLLP